MSNYTRYLPFDEVKRICREQHIHKQWIPDGKNTGTDYLVSNPTREDKNPSFSVSPDGKFIDYATGDKGGDHIDLYAYIKGLTAGEACKDLAQQLGIPINGMPVNSQPAQQKAVQPQPNPPAKDKKHQEAQEARTEARNTWDMGVPASDENPYLKRKGLKALPAANIKELNGKLLVPLQDNNGVIHSLQYIYPDGFKNYLKGSKKAGHYHTIGDARPHGTIYIAEGLATAITVHMATNQAVIMAFDAPNLTLVAQAVRRKYPHAAIVIAGDDDQFKDRNTGREEANKVARAVDGKVALPEFDDLSSQPTDWNDLYQLKGIDAVTRQLAANAANPEPDDSPNDNPFFGIDELRISSWLATEPKQRRWILPGIMPVGKTGMVVAPGGTGKSQLMLQMAISVATSVPLFGRYPIEHSGGVLAFFAEDDPEELHRRFKNAVNVICEAHEIDSERFKLDLEKNLFVASMVGRDVTITRPTPDGPILTENFDRFLATARQIPDLRLLMFDPVIRFRAGNENDASENTRLVQAGEHLSQETGAFVLWANHANKHSMRTGDAMAQEAARGSSALTDGMRWQMNMATMGKDIAKKRGVQEKERGFYVQISVPKNNYGEPFGEAWLKRGSGGYLHYVELKDTDEAENERILQEAIAIIRERGEAGDEYSKRRFCERFSGRAGELRCGLHRLRAIIDVGIERKLITERAPKQEMRNVSTVLCVVE